MATQFFANPALIAYSCDKPNWALCGPSDINVTVIDATSGPYFDIQVRAVLCKRRFFVFFWPSSSVEFLVLNLFFTSADVAQVVDLNQDGSLDLLVTNNRNDGTGSVFAYEQPSSPSSPWTRHVLATGYTPLPVSIPTPGRGAPGKAEAFWPKPTTANLKRSSANSTKPAIVLSGDDAGFVSMLWPGSEEPGDWSYVEERWLNSTGTVGAVVVGDVDSDGIVDVFVPEYGAGFLHLYSFV